jgi:threonine dehydrogenase-like Zn-dependent dehydrogenase
LSIDPKLQGAKALTNGFGPTVAVDTVGDPELMRKALGILAQGGRLSYITAPKTFDADFSFNMKALYRSEKEIIGCDSLSHTAKQMADILRELSPGFAKGGPYQGFSASRIVEVNLTEETLESYRTARTGGDSKYVICPR